MIKILDARLQFNSLSGSNTGQTIVVHHALKKICTIEDIHAWHLANGWAGCGYHFFVSKSGNIYRGRPIEIKGAHCKEDDKNFTSVGVCVEGCYQDFTPTTDLIHYSVSYDALKYVDVFGVDQTDKEMPKAQFDALVELIKYICALKGITASGNTVEPHRKYATYKLCPGNYFPWSELIQAVTYSTEVQYALDALDSLHRQGRLTSPEIWKNRIIGGEALPDWLFLVLLERISKGGV